MIVRRPKQEFAPKQDFFPKIDIDILAERLYNESLGLIKYLANRYTCSLPGYDFTNLIGEGNLAFSTAIYSWRFFPDPKSMKKYIKVCLYRHFFELSNAKNFPKNIYYQDAHRFQAQDESEEESSSDDIVRFHEIQDGPEAPELSSFDNLVYRDLSEHILVNIDNPKHRRVFKLLVDPPEHLMEWLFINHRRKQKQALITEHRVKGSATCHFNERRVFEYLRETEGMDFPSFNSILFSIREQVKKLIKTGDFANQT